jgi:preprotein translocase subunit SecB
MIEGVELAAFNLAQIYLVSAMFSHRANPLERPANTPIPPQRIGVGLSYTALNDGSAGQATVKVTTDPTDESALYDFAIEIAAIAERKPEGPSFSDADLAQILATMVYPFVREIVASLTSRGRFGPIWLNPLNISVAMRDAVARLAAQAVPAAAAQ